MNLALVIRTAFAPTMLLVAIQASGQRPAKGPVTALPSLIPVFTSSGMENAPASVVSPVRVGPQGNLLFEADKANDSRLVLLDSSGKVLVRVARTGAGPGEVRLPLPLSVGSGSFLAWDMAQARFTEWSTTGRLIRTVQVKGTFSPSSVSPRGVLGMRRDSTGLMPVLVDPVRGTVEPVFAKGRKPTHEAASSPSGVAFAPTLGLWAGGFVMANAATYRIGLYDWNGVLKEVVAREPKAGRLSKDRVDYMLAEMRSGDSPFAKMPVADLRSRIEATVVPPFSPTAEVEADASGRLWVFGIEADSAFADVFTPKGFLGTLHIGCLGFEGRASVQGNWLAVVCRPREETADVAAVIRLFKIR